MNAPRRLSLLQKGLLIIAVPLIYQAVLLGVLLREQERHQLAQKSVVRTKDVLLQLDRIFVQLLSSQGDLRMFLLTEDAKFRDSSVRSAQETTVLVRDLADLVKDNAQQKARIPGLRDKIALKVQYMNELILQAETGQGEVALSRVMRQEGQRVMDELESEIEEMRKTEEQLDRQRAEQVIVTSAAQNTLLVSGLMINVLIAVVAALFFRRNVTARLDILFENMKRVAKGESLQARLLGNDEIGELDRGLHSMADELTRSRTNEKLAQVALEKRNVELIRANRELDVKNQENETFVYSVSHDLRSPLVNLQGFSKELALVQKDLRHLFDGDLNENARNRGRTLIERDIGESVHYIQTAVTRLSAIIDALLRLSRAGRIEYHPELVDLNKMVDRVVSAMRQTIDERKATIRLEPLPSVWADATAIEQIFANIIGNAVNYLDPNRPGEITVASVAEPPLEYEDMLVFVVRDNGLGIAEAYLPKVFAAFQRLHPGMAAGEGIGLPLVRRMVERHGGKVWVESKEGEGSSFYIALPHKEHSPLMVAPKKESIRFAIAK